MVDYTLGGFTESWAASLTLNLLCYATVFVPGYFLIRYFKKSQYIERAGKLTYYPTSR